MPAPDALLLMAGDPKKAAKGKPGGLSDDGGSPEARAGSRFASAVKSGDGAKIASAYKALKAACEASEGSDELEDDDEGSEDY